MFIDCFVNIVGLRECNTPLADIYINDYLDFETLALLQSLATSETRNYNEVWAHIQNRASIEFYNDIITGLNSRIRLKPQSGLKQTSYFGEFEWVYPGANPQTRGYLITVDNCSKYLSLHIDSIEIWVGSPVSNINFAIGNYRTGQTLWTILQSFSASGFYSIPVKKTFALSNEDRYTLFVGYNTQGVLVTRRSRLVNESDGCGYVRCDYCNDVYVREAAVDQSGITIINVEPTTQPNGMVVNFSLNCNLAQFICSERSSLLSIWLTKLIITTFQAVHNQPDFTKFNTGQGEARAAYLSELKSGYEKSISSWAKNVNLPKNDCCVECIPLIQKKAYF